MKINEKIIETLRAYNINKDDAICYLISLYYGYKPSYIPDELKKKINVTNIVTGDSKGLTWKVGLYEESETNFEWVEKEYIKLFEKANPKKASYEKESVIRMKKLFANNPEIRKEDVIQGTNLYLRSSDLNFIRLPHYFIEKGAGVNKICDILTWINKYKNLNTDILGRNNITNTMQ
jgi:hypothetical protein